MSDSDQKISMTREELKDLISEALSEADRAPSQLQDDQLERVVRRTVRGIMQTFGVDVDNPLELQQDLARLRDWRGSMDAVKSKTLFAIVSILTAGLLAAVWVGFKSYILSGK